jgi:lambda repressor-like predicted transcriptional regulator
MARARVTGHCLRPDQDPLRGKLSHHVPKLGDTQDGRDPHPIAVARRLRGLSLRELASRTGVTHVGLSHIETGRVARPHATTKRAIATELGYKVVDLWPPPGKRPPTELRPRSKGGARRGA